MTAGGFAQAGGFGGQASGMAAAPQYAPEPQYAFAGYAGIAVWGRVDPPADQIRALARNERVEVLGTAGGGWMRVRLSEGYEGFVRADAVRPFAVGGQERAPRQQQYVPASAPSAYGPAAPVAYAPAATSGILPGSKLAAIGLNVFGWLMLVGGQLAGLAAAADYECQSLWSMNDCSDEGSTRVVMYLMFAIPTLVSALFAFGIAYCIGFLDRIERRSRSAG